MCKQVDFSNQIQSINNQTQTTMGQSQSTNCISYPYYQTYYPQYIYKERDIGVDKVENGYLVYCKGKRYVADTVADIVQLISDKLEGKK